MKKPLLAIFAAGLLIATPSCKKGENDPALSLKSRKNRLSAEWTVSSLVENSKYTSTYVDDATVPGELLSSTNEDVTTFENGTFSITNNYSNQYDSQAIITAQTGETVSSGATVTNTNSATSASGTVTTTSTGAYTSSGDMKITFEKDGTFTMTRTSTNTLTYTDDTDSDYTLVDAETETSTSTISGTWSFLAKNKSDEFKNKERIALWYKDDASTTSSTTTETYTDKDDSNYDYTQDNSTSTSESTYGNKGTFSSPDEIWELDMLKSKEVKAVRNYSYTNTGTSSSSFTTGGTTITSTGNPTNTTGEVTTTMTLTRD